MTATPAESAESRRRSVGGNGMRPCLPGPAQGAGQAITGRDVRAALAALDTEHRQVIIEIYYRGRSIGETADLLRIPADTVASRAYAATHQLLRAARTIRELPRVPSTRSEGSGTNSRSWAGRAGTRQQRFGGLRGL